MATETTPADRAQGVLRALEQDPADRPAEFQDRGVLLRAGFDAFIERMDAFDGETSVAIARELYAEDSAIWSGFCYEGALRRSAAADAGPGSAGFRAAQDMLVGLRESYTGAPQGLIDVTHRLAILGAGFNDRSLERRALGRALAAGGVDGAQISGLAVLQAEPATAMRLFGSLLDRSLVRQSAGAAAGSPGASNAQDDESVTSTSPIDNVTHPILQPEAAPWALRGHALASLELLRGSSSN